MGTVLQSPQMIDQWVQQLSQEQGGVASWQPVAFPTRAQASLFASRWVRGE
jgi:hypothetical protein